MKPNNLMLGDLVALNYEGVRKTVRIIRLNQNYCDVVTENGTEINSVAYSLLEGLALSEEILKVNGFEKYSSGERTWYEYDFFSIEADTPGYYYLDISFTTITIHNIDELQHALRVGGLYKLADNLKLNRYDN